MSADEPRAAAAPPTLAALPRAEELPRAGDGYEEQAVREAFDTFRRHAAQLQAQLRVLQAAGHTARVEPTGHSVRMDSLHLIRAAAEFADTLERDAQNASAAQLGRTEEEVSRRQHELQARERDVERYREESERQRAEALNAAKAEARELLAAANRDATQELREAEAAASRLLEQARHQATELANAARAEVEQTLEWARAQAGAVLGRAQQGAEQLLRAAGLGEPALSQAVEAIVAASRSDLRDDPRAAGGVSPAPSPESAPAATGTSQPEPADDLPEPPVSEPPVSEPPVSGPPPRSGEHEPKREADGDDDEDRGRNDW